MKTLAENLRDWLRSSDPSSDRALAVVLTEPGESLAVGAIRDAYGAGYAQAVADAAAGLESIAAGDADARRRDAQFFRKVGRAT